MDYVHLTKDNLLGSCQWKGRLDLLNIVLIGLSDKLPEHDEKYELHRLLGALLSQQLSTNEKLNIIETEYDIPVEGDIRKELGTMCNLSQGIKEAGIAIGEAKVIINMHKKGYTIEQIADVADKDVNEIQAIIENKESAVSA